MNDCPATFERGSRRRSSDGKSHANAMTRRDSSHTLALRRTMTAPVDLILAAGVIFAALETIR
jgi:hypothetical protein